MVVFRPRAEETQRLLSTNNVIVAAATVELCSVRKRLGRRGKTACVCVVVTEDTMTPSSVRISHANMMEIDGPLIRSEPVMVGARPLRNSMKTHDGARFSKDMPLVWITVKTVDMPICCLIRKLRSALR